MVVSALKKIKLSDVEICLKEGIHFYTGQQQRQRSLTKKGKKKNHLRVLRPAPSPEGFLPQRCLSRLIQIFGSAGVYFVCFSIRWINMYDNF